MGCALRLSMSLPLFAACSIPVVGPVPAGQGPAAPTPETSSGTTGDAAEESTGAPEEPATDTGSLDTGVEPTRFDLGGFPDLAPPEETGCQKVDLVFVVDNSGSMHDEQTNLAASFPGFAQAMQTRLEDAHSFRVGVVTTDAYAHNAEPCQGTLGAFVVTTGGTHSSDEVCGPYAEGHSFMTEADDLHTAFTCAATVGVGGSANERPMASALAALSPQMNMPGACNAGFVRDDALLVVVLITDEDDLSSSGGPDAWYGDLVASKQGVQEHVVLLALVGREPPNQCMDGDALLATRLMDLTDRFTHGFIGDVCAPSYAGYFDQAVGVIDLACEGFTPP